MTLEDANKNEKDIAEWYMITRDLIQIIGRTALRKHTNEQVIINLYQVGISYTSLMKEIYFKNCTINNVNNFHDTRSLTERLFELIKIRLTENINRDYVYIEDFINANFKSSTSTRQFLSRNKSQILKIAKDKNWEYVNPRNTNPYFKNLNCVTSDKIYREVTNTKVKEGGIYDCCSQTENSSEKIEDISTQILKFFIYSEKVKTSEIYKSLNISRNQLLEYISQYSLPLKVNGHYMIKS